MLKHHHAGGRAERYADRDAHCNTAKQQSAHGRARGNADGHAESYASVWIVHANRARNGPKGSLGARARSVAGFSFYLQCACIVRAVAAIDGTPPGQSACAFGLEHSPGGTASTD
jgi:hypothetical protein